MLDPFFCYQTGAPTLCKVSWWIVVVVVLCFLLYKLIIPKDKER